MINHSDVLINLVLVPHPNVQLESHVVNQIKYYAQIILVPIMSYNVKSLINVQLEFYVLINPVDHLFPCVQDKSAVKLDILYV